MKKPLIWLCIIILLVFAVFAADWYGPLSLKQNWDRTESGVCPNIKQCLVSASPQAKAEYNDQPGKYFTDPPGPKCIADKQHILDYYCEEGSWTTRTKLIALTLMDFASTQSNKFALFCGNYKDALNHYQYLVGSNTDTKLVEDFLKDYRCPQYNTTTKEACVNNICVLKYQDGVAIGTSLNTKINDDEHSFLLALNHSSDACDNINSGENFQRCTDWNKRGRAFYNPGINSFIYLSTDDTLPSAKYSAAYNAFIKNNLESIEDYAANIQDSNLSFVKNTRLFNNFYYSQQGSGKIIFAFLEEGQELFDYDYVGARYKGIDLGNNPCSDVFEQYDAWSFCEETSGDIKIIAKQTPDKKSPLVEAWADLSGKLRPK